MKFDRALPPIRGCDDGDGDAPFGYIRETPRHTIHCVIELHVEARETSARWRRSCKNFTKAFGARVWIGRHASDVEKLRQRCAWRNREKISRQWLAQAFAAWRPSGRGH